MIMLTGSLEKIITGSLILMLIFFPTVKGLHLRKARTLFAAVLEF